MDTRKQQLLERLRAHIAFVQGRIAESMESTSLSANKSLREIGSMQPADQMVYMQLKAYAVDRMEQLGQLKRTPYFVRCETLDADTGEKKEYFFAKHQLAEESIYSWVSPVASIRFEAPGEISYAMPGGEEKKLRLVRKEQYMIVDGKVLFFAEERLGAARELIYQEHFTKQKTEFALPEIVAQMEKAQDKVVRAHHYGPLVISGPAGSGKTTLALHRVAYLTQAPDTAALYPARSIIVFVQDNGTKEYFSKLLPGLGIHDVAITTFSEWALLILGLEGYGYVGTYGSTETEKERYEEQKLKALRGGVLEYAKDPFASLMKAYRDVFKKDDLRMFKRQKDGKTLDRFDLTVLLRAHLKKHGTFETVRRYTAIVKGEPRKKVERTAVAYSLIVVDEFQNYLPEQLGILNACLESRTRSIVYVGDMAQQIYLGTMRNWGDIGEVIPHDRNVLLDKVYRNTRNILKFVRGLGYPVGIPEGIKEGPPVLEKECASREEEVAHIREKLARYEKGTVGVIAKNAAYLEVFKDAFQNRPNVHVLTMAESQGVEFDLVCLVGMGDAASEHSEERQRIQRDLLYVALTRAITELHVLGKARLVTV